MTDSKATEPSKLTRCVKVGAADENRERWPI